MSFMFYGCSSLSSLPKIEKWNIKNVDNYEDIFGQCLKLTKMPKKFK